MCNPWGLDLVGTYSPLSINSIVNKSNILSRKFFYQQISKAKAIIENWYTKPDKL